MDKIWAPWRSKYIYLRKKARCIFCISKKTDKARDRKKYILQRSRYCCSQLDKLVIKRQLQGMILELRPSYLLSLIAAQLSFNDVFLINSRLLYGCVYVIFIM